MKSIFVTEKSSVAEEYARILGVTERKDGYLESDRYIITWCVGHLVTMSYPEKYDEKLKKWSLDTLPFLPEDYLYEVIPKVAKQFNVIKKLYHRDDVTRIYYAGDSGREGAYIQALVRQEAGVRSGRIVLDCTFIAGCDDIFIICIWFCFTDSPLDLLICL